MTLDFYNMFHNININDINKIKMFYKKIKKFKPKPQRTPSMGFSSLYMFCLFECNVAFMNKDYKEVTYHLCDLVMKYQYRDINIYSNIIFLLDKYMNNLFEELPDV